MNSVLGDLWRCVDWKMHRCDCQKRVLAITPLEKRKRRGNPEGTAYVSSALPVIAFLWGLTHLCYGKQALRIIGLLWGRCKLKMPVVFSVLELDTLIGPAQWWCEFRNNYTAREMHDYMEGSEDKSRNHLICCSALTVHIRMKRMKQRDGEDGGGGRLPFFASDTAWMHSTFFLISTEWGVSGNTTALIRYLEWGEALFSDALRNYIHNEAWGLLNRQTNIGISLYLTHTHTHNSFIKEMLGKAVILGIVWKWLTRRLLCCFTLDNCTMFFFTERREASGKKQQMWPTTDIFLFVFHLAPRSFCSTRSLIKLE